MDNNEASPPASSAAAPAAPVVVTPPPLPPPSTLPPLPPPAVRQRVNKNMDLPNLFLSTTYAINKSHSKRVAVGLEHHAGFYRAVVKLCSAGAPAKYVTLEKNSWELIVDQMDAMMGYLLDSFTFYKDFGKPSKIYLPTHDINFTTAYGVRSIVIDERPSLPTPKLVTDIPESQLIDEETQFPNCSSQYETPQKKRKYESQPGIVMQQTTLSGLREVRECVDALLKRLEESAGFINQGMDKIFDFLKDELKRESTEKAKNILKDTAAFKQYYALRKNEINNRAKLHMEFGNMSEQLYDIFLMEFHAFGLYNLANDLYVYMFTN